jgi:RNA polymerase sigma-70 factor (ECF subfamily)
MIDELVTGCLNHDRLSQHKLYNKYSKKMLRVCCRYTKSLEEAEDVLSEGFMRIFDKLHLYTGTGSFEGWMRKVMANVALERSRRVGDRILRADLSDLKHSTKETITDQLNVKELIKLIQKLSPRYQMVFSLYVFEDLTHEQIAEELCISVGTSKSNLHDARNWLKKNLVDSN